MSQAGRIKQGRGTLIGNAGEYFVVAELLRHDVVAGLAPRNAPGFDILVENGAVVRVKTKTAAASTWVWMVKEGGTIVRNILDKDFTVLVDLGTVDSPIEYFIFSTQEIDQLVKERFEEWARTPGRGGRNRNRNRRDRRIDKAGPELQKARGRWELIIGGTH